MSHEGIRQLVLKTSEAIKDATPLNTPLKRKDVPFIEKGRRKRRGRFAVDGEGVTPKARSTRP